MDLLHPGVVGRLQCGQPCPPNPEESGGLQRKIHSRVAGSRIPSCDFQQQNGPKESVGHETILESKRMVLGFKFQQFLGMSLRDVRLKVFFFDVRFIIYHQRSKPPVQPSSQSPCFRSIELRSHRFTYHVLRFTESSGGGSICEVICEGLFFLFFSPF